MAGIFQNRHAKNSGVINCFQGFNNSHEFEAVPNPEAVTGLLLLH